MTAARCSTVISPLNTPTWWPSTLMFSASQEAIRRVWIQDFQGHIHSEPFR